MQDTQMTQESMDVIAKLGGWRDRYTFENTYPANVMTDIDSDGVMWVVNDHGSRVERLEYMDLNGKTLVRKA